jgi:hypothetical protein
MNPERWQVISVLYRAALEREPSERARCWRRLILICVSRSNRCLLSEAATAP